MLRIDASFVCFFKSYFRDRGRGGGGLNVPVQHPLTRPPQVDTKLDKEDMVKHFQQFGEVTAIR